MAVVHRLGDIMTIDEEGFVFFVDRFGDCYRWKGENVSAAEVEGAISKNKRTIKPGMQQGIAFFSKMRDLVMTGFYTSEIGVKDLGYMGNTPNQWNGVPDDVLKQYGYAYSERELKECVSFDKA